jgi:translation initiation factor 2 subunit 3
MKSKDKLLPEINIGTTGHVDHGKTTLVHSLTGKWADTHSEEIKRGITIRLGYADATFYYCDKCKSYGSTEKCIACMNDASPKRTVSFIDLPGHETLMATVLSGASLIDGALMIIAANEKCPQPQTAEHLKTLDVVGIKNIVIVQNKVDLVSEERAIESYNEIKEFVKGTVAENAPIIPMSAVHNTNIDVLIEAIEKYIPTPKRDSEAKPKFYVARSFDINKPGTKISELRGSVIGGSLVQGVMKAGDEIEIKPGVNVDNKWMPLKTKIVEIIQSNQKLDEAKAGGLLALRTDLDPSLSRSDALSGNIVGLNNKMPPVSDILKIRTELFDHVIGVEGHQKVDPIKTNDVLMLTVAITKTVGVVTSSQKNTTQIKLKLPVVAEKGDKVSISKQVGGRWHLVGWGEVL